MNTNIIKILIVDDNPLNITLLQQFLNDDIYYISAANSGKKALSYIKKHLPDIILLDIMMPDMDGYETCRLIKQIPKSRDIPIIFVTAKTDPESIRYGFEVGCADYINKPVYQDELLARVQNQVSLIEKNNLAKNLILKSEKMNALGQMVSSISHEMASPLGSLKLALSFFNDELAEIQDAFNQQNLEEQQLADFLNSSLKAGAISETNIELLSQILSNFKLIAVDQCNNQTSQINLKNYIHSIILSLSPKLKNTHHTIDITIDPTLTLTIIPGALSQIIINLVNNSLLHGFEHIKQGKIIIQAHPKEHYIILEYSDNGCGMNDQHLNKIFNEYFTTKAQSGGSGIGMSIVKHLIEHDLNGQIAVKSKVNHGICITLKIPNLSSISLV
jgi:CheY-like chemotaxis protein/two-component sensor histidine kinase